MSTHRAPAGLLRSRAVRISAGVCALGVAVGLGGWAALKGPTPRSAASGVTSPSGESPSAVRLSDPPQPPTAVASGPVSPAPTSAAAAVKPTATARATPPPAGGPGQTRRYTVTLYGARDNDPPGSREIAYPSAHRQAGGTGTFADPITFATSRAELAVGTVVYYPFLKRYFVMEDQCAECETEWAGAHTPHLDLWAGESTNAGIIACEDALTRDGLVAVVVNPPSNLPVVSTPIYDGSHCYKP
jgi:hypothetical protein